MIMVVKVFQQLLSHLNLVFSVTMDYTQGTYRCTFMIASQFIPVQYHDDPPRLTSVQGCQILVASVVDEENSKDVNKALLK